MVLVVSVLSSSVLLPRTFGIALLVGAYVAFLLVVFQRHGYVLIGPSYAFGSILLLATIMTYHLVNGNVGGLTDIFFPLVTTFILCANLFVIPHALDSDYFLYGVSRISAVVVLVGLPGVVVGDVDVFWFTMESWRATHEAHLVGWEHYPLRSIYEGSQNQTAVLLFVGVIAATAEFVRERTLERVALLGTNGVGLYLTHSRGGIGVAFIGLTLIGVYIMWGRRVFGLAILAGGSAFLFGILTYFGVLPGPSWLNYVNVKDRFEIWRGGYEALKKRPLLGYGIIDTSDILEPYVPSDKKGQVIHNSYFRIFLYTGVIGGLLYMGLLFYSLFYGLFDDRIDVAIFAIAVAFAVHQFQGGAPLYGANFKAVGIGITFGYVINNRFRGSLRVR